MHLYIHWAFLLSSFMHYSIVVSFSNQCVISASSGYKDNFVKGVHQCMCQPKCCQCNQCYLSRWISWKSGMYYHSRTCTSLFLFSRLGVMRSKFAKKQNFGQTGFVFVFLYLGFFLQEQLLFGKKSPILILLYL